MEAEQVTEKILADAKAEADKIKTEAEENQAQEKAKLNEELAEYKKQSEVLAQKAAKDKKAHLLAAARMDLAKQFLAEKRKILDEVFQQAHQKLLNLPDGEYRSFMTKLMLDAVETGDEEVIVDGGEKRIDHEFIKQINRQLGPGFKGNLKLSDERANIGGGFILKRGKIKNNLSFNVLLSRARRELEIELSKLLFES
ncbi:MAG: V-type ATP synthase subunit E [Planctomycetota bacterium]|jgi:V/A-type H+-transporting ATPase subunit E